MPHDFKRFPELQTSEMDVYYFESPHKQITENFTGRVIKVHDGDTITLSVDFRDFTFPVRFLETNSPELNEKGGAESRDWLSQRILNEEVEVKINPENRVGKFGRLLGEIIWRGISMNKESKMMGFSTSFEGRNEGKLPDLNKEFNIEQWF